MIQHPRDLLQSKQPHLANDIPKEKIIAVDLARRSGRTDEPEMVVEVSEGSCRARIEINK
jgi:hypothetical protein